MKMTKFDIFAAITVPICAYISYRGFKYAKEKEKEIEELRRTCNECKQESED